VTEDRREHLVERADVAAQLVVHAELASKTRRVDLHLATYARTTSTAARAITSLCSLISTGYEPIALI
jgi:hypothetical protein